MILNIVIGVRLLKIYLHYFLTCHVTCIFNGNFYGVAVGFLIVIHREILILKACVGKTVAEGVGYSLVIIKISRTGSKTCYIVISGFSIAITDVNAFLIHNVGGIVHTCIGITAGSGKLRGVVTHVGVLSYTEVCHNGIILVLHPEGVAEST